MYFCPNWDKVLLKEVKNLNHDNFYLSGTMIEWHLFLVLLFFNFGTDLSNFKEDELLL